MTRNFFTYLLIAALLFIYPFCVYSMGDMPLHKYIPLRVLVVKDVFEISLRIKGSYKIIDFETGVVLKEGEKLQEFTVSSTNIGPKGMKILPETKAQVYINGRQFRGNIDVIKEKNKLLAINHIDLEEYLYGVLYHEVSHRWPMEVLKAQAIVARTYALYQKLITKNKYFDVSSDIYSQVYGGRTSEKWRTTKAVNLTQGMVLTYEGKLFPAYYHATCGGRTSAASTIWNIDIATLAGKECNFCNISPHYKWKRELTMDFLQAKMQEAGYKIQLISIEILERDDSGRILSMLLKGDSADIKLSGNKFRLLIGPNIIRSANFEIEMKGKYIKFYGKGWGHGIGMCQWGAYGMARKGQKVEGILKYYYPGAEIVRVE